MFLIFADAIKMAKENGNEGLYIADSIEELAEKAGIDVDNLVDTVEEYNDFCDSVDEEFFKDKRYLRPITKAPFYGARIRPGGYGTLVVSVSMRIVKHAIKSLSRYLDFMQQVLMHVIFTMTVICSCFRVTPWDLQ